jgi:hypothetical protein
VEMPVRRALMTLLAELWPGFEIAGRTTGRPNSPGTSAPRCGNPVGTGSRQYGRRTTRTFCVISSPSSTPSGNCACGRCAGTSARPGAAKTLGRIARPRVEKLALNMIPEGGAHIGVGAKTIGAWQTADGMGIFQALPELWSGWRTECWEDRYEEQVARCGGSLPVPDLDLNARIEVAQEHIRTRVFQSFSDSPVAHIAALDATVQDPTRPKHLEWARFVNACDVLRTNLARSA